MDQKSLGFILVANDIAILYYTIDQSCTIGFDPVKNLDDTLLDAGHSFVHRHWQLETVGFKCLPGLATGNLIGTISIILKYGIIVYIYI